MIASLLEWIRYNQPEFKRTGVSVSIGTAEEGVPRSMHVELRGANAEHLVQLWDNGMAEFHSVDYKRPEGVAVVHYEFESADELEGILNELIVGLCPR
jgi:hypothetical protein